MRSLLGALVAGLALSLTAVFAVQWSAVRISIDTMMRGYIAASLAQDADELYGALIVLPEGTSSLGVTHFDPSYLSPSSGRYYQVLVGSAVGLRSPSLAEHTLAFTPVKAGERRASDAGGPRGQTLLLSATGYELEHRTITIAVAEDLKPIQEKFDQLLVRYTEVSVLMFAFLVVLQVGIVRFALAPLHRVQQDVGRLERGETEQLSDRVPAEVLPLVREVNRLLALQARRLQRSRSALGNLAHALKAPLTVLTHMANDEHLGAQPTLRAHMTEQLAAMRTRIDSELRRARVAGGCSPGTMVDVPKEIDALVAAVRMLYRERNLDIACDVDAAARFHGDREDLLELCGNLLDNACKWARSQVRISARRNEGVTLAVEDDGPGCSPEDLKRITQRGVRLDESVEGHGLGLAIASDIAASYGVQLRFDRSENLGGLRARVDFPAL